VRIKAGADRGAALGKLVKAVERLFYPLNSMTDLRRIAAEFLP